MEEIRDFEKGRRMMEYIGDVFYDYEDCRRISDKLGIKFRVR